MYGFHQRADGMWETDRLREPDTPVVVAMLVDAASKEVVHLREGCSDYTGEVPPARIYASPSITPEAKAFVERAYLQSEVLRAYRLRHGVRKVEVQFVDHVATLESGEEDEDD